MKIWRHGSSLTESDLDPVGEQLDGRHHPLLRERRSEFDRFMADEETTFLALA